MIGGHEYPSEGDIVLDGQSLVGLAPHRRPTTTVFQHFALFPHRTVLENVAFGLKMHGVAKEERRKQSLAALEMVGLSELAERKPAALSGGQQQRVALARVLVTKPKALLLDEPLGDLDRLLQLRMRVELRNLQRQLGLMFIHVTHNQEEALSMADRIVVMNDARIQQVADPLTIATRPETELVARFMGDNNIIRGRVTQRDGDRLVVAGEHDVQTSVVAPGDSRAVGDEALVAVRAAAVEVDLNGSAAHGPNSADCEILFVEFLGDLVKLHLSIGSDRHARQGAGRELSGLSRKGRRADPDQLEGGGCPAPPGLRPRRSSTRPGSSGSSELEQGTRRERALGDAKAPVSAGGGWVTALWALPGTLWLGFYLVLPLVFIVLVSFWTYKLGAKSGFTTNWTLANYGTIVHSSTYWHNMLTSVYTSLIAVVRVSSSAFRSRTSSRSRYTRCATRSPSS